MPPWLAPYLKNQNVLIGAGAGLLILIIIIVSSLFMFGDSGKKGESDKPLSKQQKVLAQVSGYGKAIEIQALLSRQGLHLDQDDTEGERKLKLVFQDNATQADRDKALVTLVQSGLMDKNVGLEAFDQGDLTASREEKKIKLIRAQQGELTRLIKKIDPIEDASVSIAVPEQTLFKSEQKPISASVQVALPLGNTLTQEKVRAITNLMVGSLQGLTADHVSISDTNGITYSSILRAGSELETKLKEQDHYMQQKVSQQLNHLVGAGNYVVTVSTQLRKGNRETMVQEFSPNKSAISKKQTFNENLNSASGALEAGGPKSSFLPPNLANATAAGKQSANKDYIRTGEEVSYQNTRTQWLETTPVGTIEDISIAVTIDAVHFPVDMGVNELKSLLARAASPKASEENVTIVQSNLNNKPIDLNAMETGLETVSENSYTWMFWAGGSIALILIVILLVSVAGKKNKEPDALYVQTQQEIDRLKQVANQQQEQLQQAQQQATLLMQQQQALSLEAGKANAKQSEEVTRNKSSNKDHGLEETLKSLDQTISPETLDDEAIDLQIKSWIESS
ncbi:MAG: flagellar M-ring protein FliF C-terminal domain-containing protein [Cyanobacteria bacterium P01_H01_bin.74]